MFEKILIPLDFSEKSNHAVRAAKAVAKQFSSFVELFYVRFTDDSNTSEDCLRNLMKWEKELRSEGIAAGSSLMEMDSYLDVHSLVEQKGDDFWVMASQGSDGRMGFFSETNAERVIRNSPCPVLIVKETPINFSLKTLVWVSDFSDEVLNSFENILPFVTHAQKIYLLAIDRGEAHPKPSDPEVFKSKLLSHFEVPEHIFIPQTVKALRMKDGIDRFAEHHSFDCVLMATHQRTGLSHLLFGSLTEDVAVATPFPLLSFPISLSN